MEPTHSHSHRSQAHNHRHTITGTQSQAHKARTTSYAALTQLFIMHTILWPIHRYIITCIPKSMLIICLYIATSLPVYVCVHIYIYGNSISVRCSCCDSLSVSISVRCSCCDSPSMPLSLSGVVVVTHHQCLYLCPV